MLRTLCINLVVFIILILIVEGGLWVLVPAQGPSVYRQYAQSIPGLKKKIIYSRNQFGLRSLSMDAMEKQSDTFRILCIGASTTDQPTQSIEDTWCSLLEISLNKSRLGSGTVFQSIGYGRGGSKTSDVAWYLKDRIDRLNPDLVITLLGVNDMVWNGGKEYRPESIEKTLAAEDKKLKYIVRKYSQIRKHIRLLKSRFQLAAGTAVEWHSQALPKLRIKYQGNRYRERVVRNHDPIVEFSESVNWLVNFLVSRNKPIILLGQPVLWHEDMSEQEYKSLWFSVQSEEGPVRPSGKWLHEEMEKYNDVQQNIALQYDDENVIYQALDQYIPKSLDYYFDDCHFTDIGSARVAEIILPTIKKMLRADNKNFVMAQD